MCRGIIFDRLSDSQRVGKLIGIQHYLLISDDINHSSDFALVLYDSQVDSFLGFNFAHYLSFLKLEVAICDLKVTLQ